MSTLRDEAEKIVEQYGSMLPSHESCNNHMREAILAFAKTVLEREPSEAMLAAALSEVDGYYSCYRAMTRELLKELE